MQFKAHHTAISVKSLKESTKYYENFGFKNVLFWSSESLQIVHMKLDDFILELFCYANCEPLPDSAKTLQTDLPQIGVKHFALQVKSIEDAKKYFVEKRLAKDISITEGRTGIKYFFVKDPDGILLEIVEDKRALSESQHFSIQNKL